MFPSILIFDFDLLLGSCKLFGAQIGIYWARVISKAVLGSTHKAEQLLFSVLTSNITFVFDIILVSFLGFSGPKWAILRVQVWVKTVFDSTRVVEVILAFWSLNEINFWPE